MAQFGSSSDSERLNADGTAADEALASPEPVEKKRADVRALRPSEFMRARHPDLFSDTKIVEYAHLDRAVFDHHLETLTSRKQELAFERFARKLAEKEICPNLVPQTGPTGGGDSKVDTETYPVSTDIAARWYEGQSLEAAQQAWAFAFSTKKDWKAKVKADVAAIAETHRGYVRAYFITSRYVRDKERGETQDKLRTLYGLDVRILDRTWILEKVFENRREQLAIDTLELGQRPLVPEIKKGPRDTRRQGELDELERQIGDPARYRGIEYQLVEDSLEAALLARGLERPRIEVDGRFDRAVRMAEQYGTRQQKLRTAYNRAWTLFWWYEDYPAFTRAYDDVEQLAKGSSLAQDIGLLKNLWQLLYSAAANKRIDTQAKLVERTAILKQELQRLEQDKARAANALEARVDHLFIKLIEARTKKERRSVLGEFQEIVAQSKGLVDFPAKEFCDLFVALGEVFPLESTFDDLFEVVLDLAQERDRNATAGRLLLGRGIQKLDHGRPYEAIRLLGRAQQCLALRECRGDLVTALALCAQAYEKAGLLWAAHANMLVATSQALRDFWEEGSFTRQAYACLRRLSWLDLQLGRVPCVFAWIERAALLTHAIKLDDEERESLRDEWSHFDFALGVLLLKTEHFDLKFLTRLPATLERFRLEFSRVCLLYALGHEDALRAAKELPEDEASEEVLAHFHSALDAIEPGDLPEVPDFLERRKIELRSSVLGCAITAEIPNQARSLFLAEAILGAVEAFLATSLNTELFPYTANLHLKIIPCDFPQEPLEWKILDDQQLIEIRHSNDKNESFKAPADRLAELVIAITTQIAVPADLAHFEALFRDEQAMGRAVNVSDTSLAAGNILGGTVKSRISDWTPDEAQEYPVRRSQIWNSGEVVSPGQLEQAPRQAPIFGTGDPPLDLLESEGIKHRDRKIVSLINLPLWNKAGWKGAGFVEHPNFRVPPLMMLLFENKDAGRRILADWRRELGPHDKTGRLRITIITGTDRKNPAHYRVIVGANADWNILPKGSHFVMVSRVLTVTPSASANLDRFLSKYRKDGAFFITAGYEQTADKFPTFDPELTIFCRTLNVRPAWEIGENDPDLIGVHAEDDPVVPSDVLDPPILRTLERIKKRREPMPEKPLVPHSSSPKTGRNELCPCGSGKKFKRCHGR